MRLSSVLVIVASVVSMSSPCISNAQVTRRDITSLPPSELIAYRDAFRQLQTNGEYARLAGLHGCPDYYCHNDSRIFLPWHRAYMLEFERALQQIDSKLALHYWDWTSNDSIQNGIPKAFTDQTYQSGNGQTYPNPLLRFRIQCGGQNRFSRRFPDPPSQLAFLRNAVNNAYQNKTYSSFNSSINGPHGGLHGWVGGDMGSTTYAAYDPIFWAHHSNVDRQWAKWQDSPNGADPSSTIKMLSLIPFGTTVDDVLDYRSLGYEYDQLARTVIVADRGLVVIENFQLPEGGVSVQLAIHNMPAHPPKSYRVYVFVNQPKATVDQAVPENPHYAGFFGIFGGEHRPKQKRRHEPPQTLQVLDLAPAIARVVTERRADLEVALVATTPEGEIVNVSELPFDRVSVVTDEK